MLKGLVKKFKSAVDDTEEIDEKYFAEVMKEIKNGYKEEGLEGKSIAMSGGDTDKANSIYMQLRAESLQEKHEDNKYNSQLEHKIDINRKQNEKNKISLEDKNKCKKMNQRLNDGYYQNILQTEIEMLGFKKSWLTGYYMRDNIKHLLHIDCDNNDLIIKNKDGIVHRFSIEQ